MRCEPRYIGDVTSRLRLGRVTIGPATVPSCLAGLHAITLDEAAVDSSLVVNAEVERDSLRALGDQRDYGLAAEVARSVSRIGKFSARGFFSDTARFHRLLDVVRVTRENVQGALPDSRGRYWPAATPYLSWTLYANNGIFFQPVNTVQSVAYLTPRANAPTDSLTAMGEQLYRYALWRRFHGMRFPVWEYEFAFNSGGVTNFPPWISAQAQGYAIILFAECFRRTGDPTWRSRALEVLNSYRVLWDDGGVWLPDTSHGYWWEEFNPTVFIWNGGAQAILALGELYRATGDTSALRLFGRGVEALKYFTPQFDTGTWTLYSRTQGYTTVAYHTSHIQIMDALYQVSGDPWFKEVADRRRTYQPPPGVH